MIAGAAFYLALLSVGNCWLLARTLEQCSPGRRLGREDVGAKIVGPPGGELAGRPESYVMAERQPHAHQQVDAEAESEDRPAGHRAAARGRASPNPARPAAREPRGQRHIRQPAARQRFRRARGGAKQQRSLERRLSVAPLTGRGPGERHAEQRPVSGRGPGDSEGRPRDEAQHRQDGDAGDAKHERRDRIPRGCRRAVRPADGRADARGRTRLASRGVGVEPDEPEQRGHDVCVERPASLASLLATATSRGGAAR